MLIGRGALRCDTFLCRGFFGLEGAEASASEIRRKAKNEAEWGQKVEDGKRVDLCAACMKGGEPK